MYTAIRTANTPTPTQTPAKGYYFTLEWMYGDADGEIEKTYGPIPAERTDMALELANLLNDMVELYSETGKSGYDDYEDVPNYDPWFNCGYPTPKDTPDQKIRKTLRCDVEYTPDESGCIAELTGFTVQYYNGVNDTPYEVTLS